MNHDMIISGFGGQGVMALGKTLAEGGMREGYEVSWLPSYGPEMRGGTANCAVVISDDMIISPIVLEPTILIAMNQPSVDKFLPHVVSGGIVFVNSSIVDKKITRSDVTVHYVPSIDIATELGVAKAANMVMLGAVNEALAILKPETIEAMIRELFTGAKAKFVPVNLEALTRGAAVVQANRPNAASSL